SMRQAYTRLDASHYLYENLEGSAFKAVLLVDEQGLVIDYPGLFQRL
ncbi:TPA: putative glycolipid-binding domain-containing protein, partial [Pseudomonas aeruginosa]